MGTKDVILVLFLTSLIVQIESGPRSLRSVFSEIFVPAENPSAENNIMKKTNEVEVPLVSPYSVSEKEFNALRIEYIKNQILKKLRLKEKPSIAFAELPQPLKENDNLIPDQDDNSLGGYSDDFYGKTTQAIIFPYEGMCSCTLFFLL